jgi:hypothetical protein
MENARFESISAGRGCNVCLSNPIQMVVQVCAVPYILSLNPSLKPVGPAVVAEAQLGKRESQRKRPGNTPS